MSAIHILIFLISCNCVNTHYSLYYSDRLQTSYPIFDCLYAYLIDANKEIGSRYIRNYHLIPYCRRPDNDEDQEQVTYTINENIGQTITFDELKKQGITSEQLLSWFAPIDVAERYEMNNNIFDVFHNCSLPWFGSMCQYKFDNDLELSFSDIVDITFSEESMDNNNVTSGTCYKFLNSCNRELWPLCLDWREICDGKIDCISEEDEQWCDQLEITKCAEDEYRCHYGGQCIPLAFVKDSRLSIDCLDGSDEIDTSTSYTSVMNIICSYSSTFRCQERIGRYRHSFQCGDGQYWSTYIPPNRLSSCSNKRDIEFSRTIITSLNHIPEINCQQAFYCALHSNRTSNIDHPWPMDSGPLKPFVTDVWDKDCEPLSQHCSTEWIVIPEHPIMFGFFQFVYLTNRSVNEFKKNAKPDFVCFNAQKCPGLLATTVTVELINGLICSRTSSLIGDAEYMDFYRLLEYFPSKTLLCQKIGTEESCTNTTYFHCNESSKCIPNYRVGDGHDDCWFGEDELFTCQLNDSNRFICESDPNKCLLPIALGNGFDDCPLGEDEKVQYTQDLVKLIPFSALCDGYQSFMDFSMKEKETDETNCEWWPCDNSYTRCDNIWHCLNGADELNCPNTRCSSNEHECQDQSSGLLYCLPVVHIFDKYLDECTEPLIFRGLYFYNGTENVTNEYLSWNNVKCITSEKICRNHTYLSISMIQPEICFHYWKQPFWLSSISVYFIRNAEYLCNVNWRRDEHSFTIQSLSAIRFGYFPSITTNLSISNVPKQNQNKKLIPKINITFISFCHRGIAVLNSNNDTKICLCPPNYFGAQCQWQSQRVSLTLQLLWHSTTSATVIFQVIIMLVDEYGQIAPNSEQIVYMPSRDCDTKFNIYLLYPHRPKYISNKYSIRIDLFEKTNLVYWASWHLSIPFSFLPVNRIVTQLFIPEIRDIQSCSLACGQHGKCMRYINTKSLYFCQCDQGYTGTRCEIQYKCNCANDSFCLSPSICVCPLYKFGSYCYLKNSICQSSLHHSCQHNGLCVPNDDRIDLKGFTCFCSEGYSGARCENKNNQIDIYLDNTIINDTTSIIFLHFITSFKNAEHQRTTILKKIPFNQQILTIYVSQSFNILFLQISKQYYYLAILRETFIPSEYIYTEIHSNQYCYFIDKFLNNTILNYEYLRRTKYYPLICRENLQLMCFYDNYHMCICDLDRFSNCFFFNHTMNYDCQGYNNCENNGECFQNNETCPIKSTCVCQDCYYGTKCQFSTKGLLFSLDPILGYHIKPNISFNKQPLTVKISILISTIIFISGLINSILSIIVFHRKKPRKVGSGIYLLISSITSLCMIIILTIKFWQLLYSQMSLIPNRSFLFCNCILIDYFLKVFLASSEWLNACVAIERMISVIKGVHFSMKRSIKLAKWVISSVFCFTIITHIHDPIHRQLINDSDGDEQRIWCFVQYSPSIQIYNSFITLFHFLCPFTINLITALRIIQHIARHRCHVQPEQTYQEHLQHQLQRHQHLLFAPCMLIILSLPRLIISFMRGCMRSSRQPWLYLIGYFLSFIPSLLTFIVFVLPSKNYKTELQIMYEQTIRRFRTSS